MRHVCVQHSVCLPRYSSQLPLLSYCHRNSLLKFDLHPHVDALVQFNWLSLLAVKSGICWEELSVVVYSDSTPRADILYILSYRMFLE
jgi:hypothetical protein